MALITDMSLPPLTTAVTRKVHDTAPGTRNEPGRGLGHANPSASIHQSLLRYEQHGALARALDQFWPKALPECCKAAAGTTSRIHEGSHRESTVGADRGWKLWRACVHDAPVAWSRRGTFPCASSTPRRAFRGWQPRRIEALRPSRLRSPPYCRRLRVHTEGGLAGENGRGWGRMRSRAARRASLDDEAGAITALAG
eukprot:scaffold166231_cov36-Tisochrysis_lutea.AAC.4